MTDEQLSALLRLKRYEQPPAHYFDGLLQNVHRRQRAELLQLPLWKIALERMQTFFSEHSMGNLSYAGAMASVLVIGVTTIGLMTPGNSIERAAAAPQLAAAASQAPSSEKLLTLQASNPLPSLNSHSSQSVQAGLPSVGSQPRYVIDARPVSYEPSSF